MGVIIERLLSYRTIADDSPGLLKEVVGLCEPRRARTSAQGLRRKAGTSRRMLRDGPRASAPNLSRTSKGTLGGGEECFLRLERFLPILDATTTISPLLGLLGTLFGMIGTFQAIAASKSQSQNDSILAGVGEALYAPATGLSIAVICFIAYNYFNSRQRAVVSETEQSATKLIDVLRSRGTTTYAKAPQAVEA